VPVEYKRRQTMKNAERFITPELKGLRGQGARGRRARARPREGALTSAARRLERHLARLQAIADAAARWMRSRRLAASAELLASRGRISPPRTASTSSRAATWWSRARSTTFIPNDTSLSRSRQLLLITGPEHGRQVDLHAAGRADRLLAYCGSFVPAKSACLGPIDRIFTRIGASDDLAGGRSTFMVEMTEAAAILNNATPRSLVLVDEIGRGTSTFDGLALAYAVARHLAEVVRCYTLFATHYFELTQLASILPAVAKRPPGCRRAQGPHRLPAPAGERPRRPLLRDPRRASRRHSKDVVRAARRHLAELEKQLRPGGAQPIFSPPRRNRRPRTSCARRSRAEARRAEPKEALAALYRLKTLADD
jgi:DNA mismatch repair protein MutS